ncbi:MAG: 4Fe-4S binding protein [Desulfacinum sp.]|nr:4Fe-4S binding protein [Desulfacinum sp.]
MKWERNHSANPHARTDMRIVTVRRISQVFFFVLFLWFCAVTRMGAGVTDIRGWPVNWFLQLDPLTAFATVLTTGTLFAGLLWALVTLSFTVLFGRFFCGWVCPFGALHQAMGWVRHRDLSFKEKIRRNQPSPRHGIKFGLLLVFLGMAAGSLADPGRWSSPTTILQSGVLLAALAWVLVGALPHGNGPSPRAAEDPVKTAGLLAACLAAGLVLARFPTARGLLQTGLLDPIPFFQRSLNLVILPVLGLGQPAGTAGTRWTHGAWLLGTLFAAAVFLNWHTPRFYCRYVCPLGALLGLLGRKPLWRFSRIAERCTECLRCEAVCDGACAPSRAPILSACTLCSNCLIHCPEEAVTYTAAREEGKSAAGPDLSRRAAVAAVVGGLAAAPVLGLQGLTHRRFPPLVVRPPGSLPERDFLKRCIKCGQCVRICPTGVIQPALWEAGVEGLWTPVLDFRAGSSGCQWNCTACSRICPTAAIRRLSLEEKQGKGPFEGVGPIRIGLAFVDRNRCLPWALDRPCIVCEENCPVSPKAIRTRDGWATIFEMAQGVSAGDDDRLDLPGFSPPGDAAVPENVYLQWEVDGIGRRDPITDWGDGWIRLDGETAAALEPGPTGPIRVVRALKRPVVDPVRCVGCGICQHECPVRGVPAIRVSAENETRHPDRRLAL